MQDTDRSHDRSGPHSAANDGHETVSEELQFPNAYDDIDPVCAKRFRGTGDNEANDSLVERLFPTLKENVDCVSRTMKQLLTELGFGSRQLSPFAKRELSEPR
jgi:hypothetical protein